MQRICRPQKYEAGFSMLELMVTLPLMLLLTAAMLNLFAMAASHYYDFLGDWELIQQVRIPMEEIGRDIRYSVNGGWSRIMRMITLSTYAVIICEWSNIIMRIIGKGIEYAVARMEAIGLTKIPSP